MLVTCNIHSHPVESLANLIHRRAAFKLSRFEDRIEKVSVTVADANGPRGGLDSECLIRITLRDAPLVVIQDLDETPEKAIFRAFDRATRTVARRINRRAVRQRPRQRQMLAHITA